MSLNMCSKVLGATYYIIIINCNVPFLTTAVCVFQSHMTSMLCPWSLTRSMQL